jgi:Carbohydrate esterase, sialic acid-specific acetylesterase
MKNLFIATLIALTSVSSLKAEEKGKHLFVLSGQSNMAGLKPEVSFTPAVEAAFGKDHVVVVKDAQGSQPIRRWYKKWKPAQGNEPKENGELYDRLMGKVNTAIKGEKPATVTFVWMQGEADAKAKNGDVYAASLRGLVDQLASDMGRTNINFVIGRLSDCGMSNTAYPHWTMVREAQVAVAEADPRGAWVNTDDLNDKKNTDGSVKNELHYTDEGYKILGQRFAEKAIALISKKSDKLKK